MAIKYKWLAEQLEQLSAKQSKPGQMSGPIQDKLPSERVLALRYHVSRQTVRSAFKLLEEKGILKKAQGGGAYLSGKQSDSDQNQIFLILPEEPELVSQKFCQSLSPILSEHGFTLRCESSQNSTEQERALLTLLLSTPPKGLLIQPAKSALPSPNRDLYRLLMEKGCPILFLYSSCPECSEVSCLRYDDYSGCAMLVQELLAQGHMRIGALFQSDNRASQERYLAFMETMQEAGMSVPDAHVSWYDASMAERICERKAETGLFSHLIPSGFSDCTALICDHDGILWKLLLELSASPGLPAGNHTSGMVRSTSSDPVTSVLSECISFGGFLQGHLSERQRNPHAMFLHSEPETLGKLAAQTLLDSIKGLPVQSRKVPWKLHD